MEQQQKVRCAVMRGGPSKGAFFHLKDLPEDLVVRDRVLLSVFGSPDARQIDGLGGADPLTSKVCIIGAPSADAPGAVDASIFYTFGQVEIDEPHVDLGSLCGNLTAGVGVFAIWEKLVEIKEPISRIRIYNTNLQRMLHTEVPVNLSLIHI